MPAESNVDAARRMDGIYRLQRHIYDASRRFYLLGRDRLIGSLPPYAAPDILEIGCGTGRNLIKLARRFPNARLRGVDVSREMLSTAEASVRRTGLLDRIALEQVAAAPGALSMGARKAAFDIVLLSYVLSMVPDWESLVEEALDCLRPGGVVSIVDFGDQSEAPAWRRLILLNWLKLFHVSPRAEIERGLATRAARGASLLLHEQVGNGYAYVILLRKNAVPGAATRSSAVFRARDTAGAC